MMLKLERVPEEHMEVASVMLPPLESSLSREMLSAEEHGEEACDSALIRLARLTQCTVYSQVGKVGSMAH